MIVEIPVRNDLKNYTMNITLDGTEYTLIFEYNERDEYWYMGIRDYVEGQKIVNGSYLFRLFGYIDGFPQGTFWVVDNTGNKADPDINNFGDTVKLYYEEA